MPSLVKEAPLVGSGMFPKGREETYALPADDLFLAGTAEVALVGLHSGEILDFKRLPIRYAGISPCFRREIGSTSRDVRGLLRVHQFEKVEHRDTDAAVRFAHTLNNTAVATPRLLAAIIENLQTRDRGVRVPGVLRPYLGNREVL